MTLRQNASIHATEAQAKRFETMLKDDPDVDHFSTYVGRGAIRFILTLNVQLANPFFAQFVIVAKDLEARERAAAEAREGAGRAVPRRRRARVAARARPAGRLAAAVPGHGPGQGRGAPASRSSSPQVLGIRRRARGTSTSTGWSRRGRCASTSTRTRRAGWASARARWPAVLNAAVTGSTVTQLRDDIYLVNVVARATDDQRASFEALSSLQVPTPSGRMVPLQQFATFVEEQEFPLVWRRDRVPTLTVRADVDAAACCPMRSSARSRRRSPSSPRSCRSPTRSPPAACTRRARCRARRCSPSCR